MKNTIKSIAATNLKGSTFDETLGDITLFHGQNFAGKSTRLEALALALTHTLPGVAVRPSDIYELLASGSELRCTAKSSDGSMALASWMKGRKGGVETRFEGSLTAPSLLFSTSEFLDLTPKERTRFLFSVLPPPPLDKVGPDAIIVNLKNVKLDPHTEAAEAAVNEFCKVVGDSYVTEGVVQKHHTIQEWLQNLVEEIATITKESKAAAKTMRSTALGTTSLRSADAPPLSVVEAAKKRAHEAHTVAVGNESAAREKLDQATKEYTAAKVLAGSWQQQTVFLDGTPESLKKEQNELEEYLLREDVIQAAPVTLTEEANHFGRISDRLEEAKTTLARCKDAVKNFDKLECCPTCQAKSKGWKNAVLETLQKSVTEAQIAFDTLTEAKAASKVKFDLAQQAVNNEGLRLTTIRNSRKRLAEVVASLQLYADNASKEAPAREAAARLPALEQTGHEARTSHTTAVSATLTAKQALDAAETDYRLAVADAAAAQKIGQATAQAEKIEAKAAVGEQLRLMLHELLQACVKASIQPLVDLCNSLCGEILPAPIAFVDGEIVMEGHGVSHKTLSGTERALLYCALSVGLATTSPIRLVILDEVGRLDSSNRVKLATRLGELKAADKIDQAVLISTEQIVGAVMPSGVKFKQIEVRR